jgi:hypothetical protein
VTGPVVVFCLTYVVIASRQLAALNLDRPAGALVGAVAMVAVGGLSVADAHHAIALILQDGADHLADWYLVLNDEQ